MPAPGLAFFRVPRYQLVEEDLCLAPAPNRFHQDMRKAYARSGVRELWIIDPERLRISVYEFAREAERPVKIIGADVIASIWRTEKPR